MHRLLHDLGHALVELGVGHALAARRVAPGQAQHLHAQDRQERRLVLVLARNQALAQAQRLVHQLALLQELLAVLVPGGVEQPVGTLRDGGGKLALLVREDELAVVVAVQQVAAHVQLLQELGVGRRGHVHVPVVALVALGVVLHSLLQRAGDADVVHNQAALLAAAHAVHAGDGLHQVVALHGLEHVHGRQARDIEAGKPHVHDDGDL